MTVLTKIFKICDKTELIYVSYIDDFMIIKSIKGIFPTVNNLSNITNGFIVDNNQPRSTIFLQLYI